MLVTEDFSEHNFIPYFCICVRTNSVLINVHNTIFMHASACICQSHTYCNNCHCTIAKKGKNNSLRERKQQHNKNVKIGNMSYHNNPLKAWIFYLFGCAVMILLLHCLHCLHICQRIQCEQNESKNKCKHFFLSFMCEDS